MRLFIAIPLSDTMKDALTAVQDEMYDNGVRGNFTSRENMHLTLAFIGEYPDKERFSFRSRAWAVSATCGGPVWMNRRPCTPWSAASAMRWPTIIFRLTGNVFHPTSH